MRTLFRLLLRLIPGVVLLLLPSVSHAMGKAPASLHSDCTWLTDGKPYGYCVSTTEGSTSQDILYYMHGAHTAQDSWWEEQNRVWRYWADQGVQIPRIVDISFGPIWLLAQKNGSAASGLLEYVANTYIPHIEASIGGLPPGGRRLLAGESMGGFNAIQLAMKYPQMFAKAAIMCPDVTTLTPYSSLDEVEDFMHSTGTDFNDAFWEIVMDRIFFANDGSWNDAAPLLAGAKYLGPQTPPLYISGGEQDQFGFYPGTVQFVNIAESQGAHVQWAPVPGPHCSYDVEGVAQFLEN